jgi:hypothetical protein
MPAPQTDQRKFCVHAADLGHSSRIVEEASFEAAAVAYAEDYPLIVGEDDDLRVIVQDMDSGQEHCFRINLDTGSTAPCA